MGTKILNVFAIAPRIPLEDRFTASLAYLFGVYPTIGQAFLDRLCKLSGLKKSRFLYCETHPTLNGVDKPDLLFRTKDFQLLVENKIDSPIGANQLERYLALARKNRQKLALITRERTKVPPSVQSSSHYIKPNQYESQGFLWSDFYSVFESQKGRLSSSLSGWIYSA